MANDFSEGILELITPREQLMYLCTYAQAERIKVFINQHPESPRWSYLFGETALLTIANLPPSDEVTAIASMLIAGGADVSAKHAENITPLHRACKNNNRPLVDLLLDNGAHIDAGNNMGNTPFLQALASRNEDLAFYLLSQGANPNLKSPMSTMWEDVSTARATELSIACKNYDPALRPQLLEAARQRRIQNDTEVLHTGTTSPLIVNKKIHLSKQNNKL